MLSGVKREYKQLTGLDRLGRAAICVCAWLLTGLALSGCTALEGQGAVRTASPAVSSIAAPTVSVTETLPARTILTDGSGPLETAPAPASATVEPAGTKAPQGGPPAEAQTSVQQFDPAEWKSLPVLPELSQHAVSILKEGIALGNNPRAFSKIGDCESRTTWFLGDFDLGEQYYSLGPYEEELAPVIGHYQGSFNRFSLAAKPGFTAASLLSPIWADRELCQTGESPLACEYRLHRPIMAFILIGTNDASNPKTFEGHMRKVIEYSLDQRVLPVLGTKADNVEGDHAINETMARLAYEYDVPLWNYWRAVQDLPGRGLQPDGVHLTFSAPHFDSPSAMKNAWPVRNLNALQILRRVMDETR